MNLRPKARAYLVEGKPVTLQQVAAQIQHVPYDALNKRLRNGWSTWEQLGKPARTHIWTKQIPQTHAQYAPPCPLNAAFRQWTFTTRGRALNLLDVRVDPLRAAL
jgi:hypothetical protein